MTRVDRALIWWRGHDEHPIPQQHLAALNRAGLITEPDADGVVHLIAKKLTDQHREILDG